MISQMSELMGGAGTLQETLRQLRLGEEELLAQQADFASATLQAATDTLSLSQEAKNLSSGNVMSRNFAGATEQSRYVEANLAAHQAEQQMVLSSQLVLQAATAEMLAANGIDPKSSSSAAGASMAMRRISNTKTMEASERNLDEIREELDRKTREATAPTDANGRPIETGTTDSGEEAAPMPEISGSNPAPMADIAPTAAPATPVATATAPEIAAVMAPDASAAAALRMRSINITV